MNLKYEKVKQKNVDIAFMIQKELWPDEPDYENFKSKASSNDVNNISWIVFYDNIPIGITGVYTEDLDEETIWLDWYGVLPKYRKKGFGKKILLDTIEYCKKLDKYEYLRLDTTYWKGRPAISLYDKIMTFKEKYTTEDQEENHNWWIYTYSLKGKKELWNNRYLGLSDYYNKIILEQKREQRDGTYYIENK